MQAGFLEDKPAGSPVRETVLTDRDLTERQKQILIEVYDAFRKETALARAQSGDLDEDPAGAPATIAELAWPEDISPAALDAEPEDPAGAGDDHGASPG